MKRGEKIERGIYNSIKNSENGISTREISLQNKISWHTADRYCLKLQVKNKIKTFSIGNVNIWVVSK